jgi:hypothetical protein
MSIDLGRAQRVRTSRSAYQPTPLIAPQSCMYGNGLISCPS